MLPSRFWDKVAMPADPADCWLWTGAVGSGGYGNYALVATRGEEVHANAHRVAYEDAFGPIPSGLVIDHLCRVTTCVNPDHLEAVTQAENVDRGHSGELLRGAAAVNAAKTDCKRGHPLEGENLKMTTDGRRQCRTCLRTRARRRMRAKRSTIHTR